MSYFWHGGSSLGTWNRIIMGSTQGLDNDIADLVATGVPRSQLVAIYTQAMVYSMQMTDELISGDRSSGRFRGGGNGTHWPYGGGVIEYCKRPGQHGCASVFVPAVLPPPAGAPKDAPTTLSLDKIRAFSMHGGDESWALPLPWAGKKVSCRAIGAGAVAPTVAVAGHTLTLKGMPKATPVVLTVGQAQ